MALSGVGSSLSTSLLAQTGSAWSYTRGTVTTTISLYMSTSVAELIDDNQQIIKSNQVDFIGAASSLPFGDPKEGDSITNSTSRYEVNSRGNESCFRQTNGMTRIFTIQVQR